MRPARPLSIFPTQKIQKQDTAPRQNRKNTMGDLTLSLGDLTLCLGDSTLSLGRLAFSLGARTRVLG